jgi:hypothetical protein
MSLASESRDYYPQWQQLTVPGANREFSQRVIIALKIAKPKYQKVPSEISSHTLSILMGEIASIYEI